MRDTIGDLPEVANGAWQQEIPVRDCEFSPFSFQKRLLEMLTTSVQAAVLSGDWASQEPA